MDQKCLPSWRNPARYPTSPDADAFVHASHLMGGVHQRGGRRAAHRAAHRGAVSPERSGRSILKLTSLCRCAGPQEAAFCVLRAMRHRGCYGIGGRVFEHRVRTCRPFASSAFGSGAASASCHLHSSPTRLQGERERAAGLPRPAPCAPLSFLLDSFIGAAECGYQCFPRALNVWIGVFFLAKVVY